MIIPIFQNEPSFPTLNNYFLKMLINSPTHNLYTSRLQFIGQKRKKSYLNLTSSKLVTRKASLCSNHIGQFQLKSILADNNSCVSNGSNKIHFQRSGNSFVSLKIDSSDLKNDQNMRKGQQNGKQIQLFTDKTEGIRNQKLKNQNVNQIYFTSKLSATKRKLSSKKKKLSLSMDKPNKIVQKTPSNQNRKHSIKYANIMYESLVTMQVELPSMESSNNDY